MDLDQLCVHDNNIRFSDNVRMQERRKNPIETTDTKYVRSTVNILSVVYCMYCKYGVCYSIVINKLFMLILMY